MPKAVQFKSYGGIDVLEVVQVDMPLAGPGDVVVQVKAASINPGEAKIRQGLMHNRFPATFPSGEGSDFAGVVNAIGPGVTKFKPGDEVVGHTDKRGSHAEYAVVSEDFITIKPQNVSWEVAGSLFVAGATAYASVRAVGTKDGDKIVVSGAGGGVGSIAVQLARLKGADVYGIAGEHDFEWLRSKGVIPISYDGDVLANIKESVSKPDAFLDTVGKGYVKMAIDLGVDPQRINTIADFAAVDEYGVKSEGSATASSIDVMEELVDDVSKGLLEVPIAKTFKLDEVREAFKFLEEEHHRGKVVLLP